MVSTLLKKGFYLKLLSQINCIVYLYTFFQWVGILASYMQSSESLRVWKEKQNNIDNWTELKWNANFITVISTRNSILNELRGLKKYIYIKISCFLEVPRVDNFNWLSLSRRRSKEHHQIHQLLPVVLMYYQLLKTNIKRYVWDYVTRF